MASLTAQMEVLQQQQAILADKIKEEEEKKKARRFNYRTFGGFKFSAKRKDF